MQKLLNQPKLLFLIDGLGAITSAVLLGIVLPLYVDFFGVPIQALQLLATLPIFFAIYDFTVYAFISKKLHYWLTGIAILNSSYCIISIQLTLIHIDKITGWGMIYITAELLIVAFLTWLEGKKAFQLYRSNH